MNQSISQSINQSINLLFYTTCIRPVLQYAYLVFHHSLPQYLSNEMERLGGGGDSFSYIPLNEIQTMFSQLAKPSARGLPADLCTDHAHYVKNHRSTVLRKNKNMAVEGGTVSHYYILVIRKFIDFMSLFIHSVWVSFSVKQFSFAEFGICNI